MGTTSGWVLTSKEMVGSYGVATVELGQGVAGYTAESDAGRVVKCNNMQQLCPMLEFAS